MVSDNDELARELDASLVVTDDVGRVVLQVAFIFTIYFAEPHRRDVREVVVSCCEDYFRWCGDHLRWALNPNTDLPASFGSGEASDPRSWLLARGEEESFSFLYHGAEHARGACSFSLEGLGEERRAYPLVGYFRVSVPVSFLGKDRGTVLERALMLCERLKPVSGYGGIGVIESPDTSISSKYEPIVYSWAQRFPGLEADYPTSHLIWLPKGREDGRGGIKGVNWLTVIADRWLAELGGVEKVQADLAALDAHYIVHRFGGGVMIQAGPRPQLGDAEENRWPELYVKLSKYLKPIRITRHRPFQYAGPGLRFDLDRSKAWLRRFDDR
jgi:Protein of unknown function (DUF3396)